MCQISSFLGGTCDKRIFKGIGTGCKIEMFIQVASFQVICIFYHLRVICAPTSAFDVKNVFSLYYQIF